MISCAREQILFEYTAPRCWVYKIHFFPLIYGKKKKKYKNWNFVVKRVGDNTKNHLLARARKIEGRWQQPFFESIVAPSVLVLSLQRGVCVQTRGQWKETWRRMFIYTFSRARREKNDDRESRFRPVANFSRINKCGNDDVFSNFPAAIGGQKQCSVVARATARGSGIGRTYSFAFSRDRIALLILILTVEKCSLFLRLFNELIPLFPVSP